MRVLVVTHSERTHLLGLVPLAWAFRARGDDVVVATQPALAADARAAGLPVAAVGRDTQLWRVARALGSADRIPPLGHAAPPLSWDFLRAELERAVPWWWRMVNDPMSDDLVALCRRWRPDLVLWGAVTFAGAVAAHVTGARHARVLFGADLGGRLHRNYLHARPAECGDDPLLEWLDRVSTRHGGGPVDRRVAHGEATIDYLPPSLRLAAEPDDAPPLSMRFVPYHGRGVVPGWLRRRPTTPRACITLGRSAFERTGRHGVRVREVVRGVSEALGPEAEVVLTVPGSLHDSLGPMPPQVRLTSFVPLDPLAPTCSIVVNHGGGGTLCTVARHGVPQLVLPLSYDEPVLGEAVERCGAGRSLDPASATAADVAAAVAELTGGAYPGAGVRLLREQILAMPSPADVAHRLAGGDWGGR